ncbi:MAG: hypothetical protein CH104c_0255 [Candidatus Woesebacteria bacterium]|nr:MAG: hypothetical protein CH104c_0255 [Candidatus Woesebacteria bacterium]
MPAQITKKEDASRKILFSSFRERETGFASKISSGNNGQNFYRTLV